MTSRTAEPRTYTNNVSGQKFLLRPVIKHNVNRVATLVTTILTTMVLLPLPLYFIRKQNSHCQLTSNKGKQYLFLQY